MIRHKAVCLMLGILITISMLFISCTTEETTTPTAAPTTSTAATTSPTAAVNWWDSFGEPQYGGTIIVKKESLNGGSFRPAGSINLGGGGKGTNNWLEGLTFFDWTVDRDIWPYTAGFAPEEYYQGLLAESWEWKDPTTLGVQLRQGVYWQDKPPVDGRELTADDVVFNFDMVLGTGNGFTEPDPMASAEVPSVERVVSTGKYTVEFQMKQAGVGGLYEILNGKIYMVPPEWVQQSDMTDWESVIGTGPWMLTDFVVNTSMTLTKNPNYWGYDERHPENQLPYAETLKYISITDKSTMLAAVRSGQVDIFNEPSSSLSWQQSESLAKTNPEIEQSSFLHPGAYIALKCDEEPFNDIRVRQALQLAVNITEIAENYYGGNSDGKPVGIISPTLTGWVDPYNEWPADLQEEYSYNPEGAKDLLAEAAADGVFEPNEYGGFNTEVIASTIADTQLLQAIKDYFLDIGVDMYIQTMDPQTHRALVSAHENEAIVYDDGACGKAEKPTNSLLLYYTKSDRLNYTFNNDSTFDAIYDKAVAASTEDELKVLVNEANTYALKQHWSVNVVTWDAFLAWQPWVKGYNGEMVSNDFSLAGACYARLWIDEGSK